MPQPVADRNLIFGILALQKEFITQRQLVFAMESWVFDKKKTLGDILCVQKALTAERRSEIEALVEKNLSEHGNDFQKCLTAVSAGGEVRKHLESITDVDVQASLEKVPSPSVTEFDPYATVAPAAQSKTDVAGDKPAPLPSALVPSSGMRFRLVRPHAKGGLGEVFVAHDEELNRNVALKEIQDRQADNPDSRTRFMLEAEITGGLEHPGIVPVYGLGAYADGRPYYAMRFIRGDSMKEAIERYYKAIQAGMPERERGLELRSLLRRFVDVCNAIGYAHSRDILHRDLKPANIMLGEYGETLVVDWGLAKPIGSVEKKVKSTESGEGSLMPASMSSASQTLLGAAVGTPQYMSPEQAAGKLDQLGPATDIYSLGATLYCILTGQASVNDNEIGKVIQRVQRGDFPRPRAVNPEIPRALEAVRLKAMALKPADRYASAKLLASDVEQWLADEPVTAWQEPFTVKARRWIGRHATLVTSVGSAVVVGLVGLIVATILLTAANKRETVAKQEAIKQKEKAEENFQLARSAVDTYHTRVSEDDLLKEPGMQPLQKKLLEAASEYYRKFIKERAGDPNVQGELGKATFRLAQITGEIESNPKAIELHESAAKIFETLPPEKASDDFRADQAACYHHLGRLHRLTGDLEKSNHFYDKALKLWTSLADASPQNVQFRAGLARTQMGIGNARNKDRKLAEAQAMFEKSLATWNDLRKTNPGATEYDREIGVNHSNLAQVHQATAGKAAEAKTALRAAHAIQKKLADDAPNIGKFQDDAARTSYLLARSLYSAPESEAEAKPLYAEAAQRWESLVTRNPTVTIYQLRLAEAYIDLTNLHRSENDFTEADGFGQKVVALQRKLAERNKDDATYQSTLARGLVTLGDVRVADRTKNRLNDAEAAYGEAVAIQEKLIAPPTAPADFWRDLALTYQSLGVLHEKANREEKATDAFQKSLGCWEKLAARYPDIQEYAVGRSNVFFSLGNVSKSVGELKKAEEWYTQAVASFDAQKLKSVETPQIQNALCSAYWMRADTRTQLKQNDSALADWTRAFELARPGQKPAIQLPRAAALARAGKYTEAIGQIEGLVSKAKAPESLYRFACVYALSAGAAKDRKDLADEYAAQAIKLLTTARDGNYFNSSDNQKKLSLDPDLQALRDRPAFKMLASEFKLQ